jgi:hypothetical protein
VWDRFIPARSSLFRGCLFDVLHLIARLLDASIDRLPRLLGGPSFSQPTDPSAKARTNDDIKNA